MHRIVHAAAAVTAAAALTVPALASPAAATLPPLDRDLLGRSVAGLPDRDVRTALVDVRGRAGRWSATSGEAPDGEVRIGSITKVFTSTVVLQLAGERRLALDAPVRRYLPRLLPDHYPDVTVRQLLDHTSGLPLSHADDATLDPAWFVRHRFRSWTPREIVADAVRRPMEFAPGTAQRYNGVNYFVVGLVIRKVTGDGFARELRARVLRPLDLDHTYLPHRDDPEVRGPHHRARLRVGGRLHDVTRQSPYAWAEGGMVSTIPDLARFWRALVGGRLLSGAQQRELFRVPDLPYVGDAGHCRLSAIPGRACFSAAFERTELPNGVTLWGKSGSVPGYAGGVFGTRDRARVLTYSLTPTSAGAEGARIGVLVAGAFDPALAPAPTRAAPGRAGSRAGCASAGRACGRSG